MNDKEIAELRRRLRPEKNSIPRIKGCYVNEDREVISLFEAATATMSLEEADRFFGLFRKTLGGGLGRSLIDLSFAAAQVAQGEEHRLLRCLCSTALQDTGALETFYQRVIEAVDLEGQYVILLAADTYDVPCRSGEGAPLADASDQVFRYMLCSICPVKEQAPALCYAPGDSRFHANDLTRVVAAPELGFLFPAFDGRATNLYNALYYTKNTAQSHQGFVDAIFRTPLPPPAAVQKETFCAVLGETLADTCSLEVVQAVHEEFAGMVEQHRLDKDPGPLTVSKGEMRRVLDGCGVDVQHLQAFEERYDEAFGAGAAFSPKNLVDPAKFELRTPSVTIRVDPQRSDLVETRVIDGCQYILIRAAEGVEVNGVPIRITQEE